MSFYTGYAAGHAAGQNKAGVTVNVQSYYDKGVRDGKAIQHEEQAWYVKRLALQLAVRNSQKQALMRELRKYAPDHPYLNETAVPNNSSELRDRIQRGELTYADVVNSDDIDVQSRLLALELGGGIETDGDMAMVADGVAFSILNSPELVSKREQLYEDLNPDPNTRIARQKFVAEQAKANEKARADAEKERVRAEKAASGNWFAKILGK